MSVDLNIGISNLDARTVALDKHRDGTSSDDRVYQRSVGDALDVVVTELQARKGGGGLGEAITEGVKFIVDVVEAKVQKDNDVCALFHASRPIHLLNRLFDCTPERNSPRER